MGLMTAGIIGGGALLGAGLNYLSNRQQGRAAERAGRQQMDLAREQGAALSAAGQRGSGLIGLGTERARQDLFTAQGSALRELGDSYRRGRSSLGNAYRSGRDDVGAGF